jgi:hypothetical protein
MILEHVYSNALPYLIIESPTLQRLLFGRQLLKEVAVGAIHNIKKDGLTNLFFFHSFSFI